MPRIRDLRNAYTRWANYIVPALGTNRKRPVILDRETNNSAPQRLCGRIFLIERSLLMASLRKLLLVTVMLMPVAAFGRVVEAEEAEGDRLEAVLLVEERPAVLRVAPQVVQQPAAQVQPEHQMQVPLAQGRLL
jgi:hypothetical protein